MRDRHTAEHTAQSTNVVDTQLVGQGYGADLTAPTADKTKVILQSLHAVQVLAIEPSLDVGLGSPDLHEAIERAADNISDALGVAIAMIGKLVIAPAESVMQPDRFKEVVGVIFYRVR